jgi:hypothetical protein
VATFINYPQAIGASFGFKAYILNQCSAYKLVPFDIDLPLVNIDYVIGGPIKSQISSKYNYDIDLEMWAAGFNKQIGSSVCGEVVQSLRMVDKTTVPSFIKFDYSQDNF